MQRNACVFVDGENLRHSLIELLKDTRFSARDYLPEANWADLFDWVVYKATYGACTRLRTYWYVIDEVDFHPWGLGKLQRGDKGKLKTILSRNPEFRRSIRKEEWRLIARRCQALEHSVRPFRCRSL